jgi:hypothetical protein
MQMIYCTNCGKINGFKRNLGVGTFFMVVLTAALWLFALPFYPKRCIVCGIEKRDVVDWRQAWRRTAVQMVLAAGVIMAVVFGFMGMSSQPRHPQSDILPYVAPAKAKVAKTELPQQVVPDSITKDESFNHIVRVDPFDPHKNPTDMRTTDFGWSDTDPIYEQDGVQVYVGSRELTSIGVSLISVRNWWSTPKFGLAILKDYRDADQSTVDSVLMLPENDGMPPSALKNFRFVQEMAFIDMTSHIYTIVGRKYVDRYGECLYTTPEGFRLALDINPNSPTVDGMASWSTSRIIHKLSDAQEATLDVMGIKR